MIIKNKLYWFTYQMYLLVALLWFYDVSYPPILNIYQDQLLENAAFFFIPFLSIMGSWVWTITSFSQYNPTEISVMIGMLHICAVLYNSHCPWGYWILEIDCETENFFFLILIEELFIYNKKCNHNFHFLCSLFLSIDSYVHVVSSSFCLSSLTFAIVWICWWWSLWALQYKKSFFLSFIFIGIFTEYRILG